MSLLTGRRQPPRRAGPASRPSAERQVRTADASAIEALNAELRRKETAAEEARAETTAERAKAEGLRKLLSDEAEARASTQGELARERAVSEGLRTQLDAERAVRTAMQTTLDQAVCAAAKPAAIHMPAYEPPTYEIDVVGHDMNNRARKIILKPIKAGA